MSVSDIWKSHSQVEGRCISKEVGAGRMMTWVTRDAWDPFQCHKPESRLHPAFKDSQKLGQKRGHWSRYHPQPQ